MATFSTDPGRAFVGVVGKGKSARQDKCILEAFRPAPYDRRTSVLVGMMVTVVHVACFHTSTRGLRIVKFAFDPVMRFVEKAHRLGVDCSLQLAPAADPNQPGPARGP
jgi:hypothetical protein